MDLNRTQFDKYLTGSTMPESRTIRRICDYFEISDTQLFSDDTELLLREVRNTEGSLEKASIDVIRPLWGEPAASIKPGTYFLWISVPTQPDYIVCAPVFLERKNDVVTFRRITGTAEPKDRIWWHKVGDHKGIVVERLSWLHLVGVNQRGNQEPSMIRLRWIPLSKPVLGGHATILTPAGISFAAVCMRPAPPEVTFRQALRQSRRYHKDDAVVDEITRMILAQQKQEIMKTVLNDLSL